MVKLIFNPKNENNLTKGLYYLVLYGEAKSEFVKLIVE